MISLDEAVHSSRRQWKDWAHGEWVTIPGLGAEKHSEDYNLFMRAMHSWANRHGFAGNMTRVRGAKDDARFRLRWRRTHTADFYLLYSTSTRQWLDGEGRPSVPSEEYWRATAHSRLSARELCMRAAAEAVWPERTVRTSDASGKEVVGLVRRPPLVPLHAGDLPAEVSRAQVVQELARAEEAVLLSLRSGRAEDLVIDGIAATAARGRFEQDSVHVVGWEDWKLEPAR